MALILGLGVRIALVVMLAGVAISLVEYPGWFSAVAVPGRRPGQGQAEIHSISQVVDGVRGFDGWSITMAGLLFLVLVPVARVAFSIVLFIHQRDLAYAVITSIVFIGLLISFLIGVV